MSDIPYEGVIPISVPIPVPVRYDDLIAEVERLRAELAAMRQQRDEAQRDAERYRWLKSKGCDWITIYRHPSGDEFFDGKADERMDERIDAARSRDEEGGGE